MDEDDDDEEFWADDGSRHHRDARSGFHISAADICGGDLVNRVHGIASGNGTKWTTFCGKVGWSAKLGANEYETERGDRFEALSGDKRKVTCLACRKHFGSGLANPVTFVY